MDERQTLAEFLSRWPADVARIRLRPRTFDGYESTIQNHINPHIGRCRLTRLTPLQLQAWMGQLERSGVSANRRRYARVVLRNALNTAVKWRLVTVNVSTLIDAPRTVKAETRVLAPEQAKGLLGACADHPLEAFFTVALACGLRLGESLGLQWSDVDVDAGTLRIQRAIQRYGGSAAERRPWLAERKRLLRALRDSEDSNGERRNNLLSELEAVRSELAKLKTQVHFTEPKSARSRRVIALPGIAIAALKSHKTRQLKARLLAGGDWREMGLVFASSLGTPLDPGNVTRQFKALLQAAKLPDMRIHDLRHSCATLLLAQGVNPRVVMETLGHSKFRSP